MGSWRGLLKATRPRFAPQHHAFLLLELCFRGKNHLIGQAVFLSTRIIFQTVALSFSTWGHLVPSYLFCPANMCWKISFTLKMLPVRWSFGWLSPWAMHGVCGSSMFQPWLHLLAYVGSIVALKMLFVTLGCTGQVAVVLNVSLFCVSKCNGFHKAA